MENTEIVVGTYENLLVGYQVVSNQPDKSLSPVLETSFTDDSHRGALRCVAVSSSGLLASSSTDDSIRLHSLKKRKEIGSLFEHRGTVNSMVFYDNNHMFSASEDGTICLWKTKNWELMRTLKGHKGQVMAVAIHPSGKLGLSVGSDRSFLTWDLLTGKLAFQRKLQDVAQNLFFTPTGDHYVVVFNKKIEVCLLADTKVVTEIPTEWRINTVCHIEENIFAVGGDDRHVKVIDVLTGTEIMSLDAAKSDEEFRSRVRCVCVLTHDDGKLLILATTNGNLKIFRLDLNKCRAEELLFSETRVRVTAMGVYSSSKSDKLSNTNGTAAPSKTGKKSAVTVTEDLVAQTTNDSEDEASESKSDDSEDGDQSEDEASESENDDSEDGDQSEDEPAPKPKKRKPQQDLVKQVPKKRKQKLPERSQSSKSQSHTLKTKKKKEKSDVKQMHGSMALKKMKAKKKKMQMNKL